MKWAQPKECAGPWCDRKFYPSRSDALYCGDTCRQQAHRERKAGALAVTPPSVTGKSPVTAVTDKRPVTDSPPSAVTPAPRTPVTPGPRPRGIDALLAELGPLVAELERHTDSGDLSDPRRLRDHPFADGAHQTAGGLRDRLVDVADALGSAAGLREEWPC